VDQLTLEGNLTLAVNTTGSQFSDTITLPSGEEINLNFSATEGNITRLQGDVMFNIADAAYVSGEFFFEKQVDDQNTPELTDDVTQLRIGANQVNAFVGSGFGTASAVGVALNNGNLGLIINQEGSQDAKYALSATGDASIIGISALELKGTLNLNVNRMDAIVDETITLPSGETVNIAFTSADDITQVSGNLELNIANTVKLSGSFGFEQEITVNGATTNTNILVGANQVNAFIGADGSGFELTQW
jgi:hypothetical protein